MTEQSPVPDIGKRIRDLRRRRGLTQRGLAGACGLSANAVGLIERGESSPSVSTLYRIALALDVAIADLFDEAVEEPAAVLVKEEQRTRVRRDLVVMENLATGLADQCMEPFLATLQPGAGTGAGPVVHLGEEFVFCLEGAVTYQVAGRTYHLQAGDSLMFQAHQPHCWRNAGAEPARLLLIFHAAEDSQKWWHQHLEQ